MKRHVGTKKNMDRSKERLKRQSDYLKEKDLLSEERIKEINKIEQEIELTFRNLEIKIEETYTEAKKHNRNLQYVEYLFRGINTSDFWMKRAK